MKSAIDFWNDSCQVWRNMEGLQLGSTHPIHSSIIGGTQHFFHSPNLHLSDPEYFQKLQEYATQHKIVLKADRRNHKDITLHSRRKAFLPIIFLTLGLSSPALAMQNDHQPHTPYTTEEKNGKLHNHHSGPAEAIIKSQQAKILSQKHTTEDTLESKNIENILRNHYISRSNDPPALMRDIKNLARYYSLYPEAIKLINSISKYEWELRYAPHTFQTDIVGTRLSVKKITIYFDPLSAAKLKFYDKCKAKTPFCVASPADALLHEFLHVQAISKDIKRFIADGGMSAHVYPSAHERQTIEQENVLYKAMSERDKKPRPIRSEHSGRHVLVSCVTCLK